MKLFQRRDLPSQPCAGWFRPGLMGETPGSQGCSGGNPKRLCELKGGHLTRVGEGGTSWRRCRVSETESRKCPERATGHFEHKLGGVQETSSCWSGSGRGGQQGPRYDSPEVQAEGLGPWPALCSPVPPRSGPGCGGCHRSGHNCRGESLASCVSLNRSSRNNAASCGCPPARPPPALPPRRLALPPPALPSSGKWGGVRGARLAGTSITFVPGRDRRPGPASLWGSVSPPVHLGRDGALLPGP